MTTTVQKFNPNVHTIDEARRAFQRIKLALEQLEGIGAAAGSSIASHDHTGAGDGGTLTNDTHDGYEDLLAISTPASPSSNHARLFLRLNAGNVDLILKSNAAECVVCTVSNTVAGGTGGAPIGLLLGLTYTS